MPTKCISDWAMMIVVQHLPRQGFDRLGNSDQLPRPRIMHYGYHCLPLQAKAGHCAPLSPSSVLRDEPIEDPGETGSPGANLGDGGSPAAEIGDGGNASATATVAAAAAQTPRSQFPGVTWNKHKRRWQVKLIVTESASLFAATFINLQDLGAVCLRYT